MDPDTVVLMAARASRIENQDAIDTAIVGMLADPKEVNLYIGGVFLSKHSYEAIYRRILIIYLI